MQRTLWTKSPLTGIKFDRNENFRFSGLSVSAFVHAAKLRVSFLSLFSLQQNLQLSADYDSFVILWVSSMWEG